MTRHRQAEQPRPRPTAAAAVAAAAVAGVLAGVVGAQLVGDDYPAPHAAPSPTRTAPATRTITATVTPTATTAARPAGPDPAAAARAVTPLQNLHKGDRVLYDGAIDPDDVPKVGDPRRKECIWVLWAGSITTSKIRCGDEVFNVPTGRLTPVERLAD